MPNPIQFYYDFASPFGYMEAPRNSVLAAKHGRSVEWTPILLGVYCKVTGAWPLLSVPLKGRYSRR